MHTNSKLRTLIPTLALTFALPVVAQDSKPTSKAQKLTTPAIVVKSTDDMVAMGMLSSFGSPDPLPKLEDGQHYVLKLFSQTDVKISTGKGKVGFVTATIRPALLMKVFDDDIQKGLGEVEPMAMMGMGQIGIPTKEAAKMIKALIGFPKQIDTLDLVITGKPMETAKGMGIDVNLVPAKNTWLSRLVNAMQPNDQGAPVVDVKDAVMNMSLAVKPVGLTTLVEPMLDVMASLGSKNKDERTKNRKMISDLIGAYDGSMTVAGDPFTSNISTLAGLGKPKVVKALMASKDFGKLQEKQAAIVPMIDSEFEQVAFKHRDISVSRLTIDMSAAGMDQVTNRYDAVAGSYLISYSGEGKEGAKRMIDNVLDQKVKRKPLSKGALMTMAFDMEKMFDQLAGLGIPAAMDEDTPEKLNITLFRGENSLRLKINTK